MKKFLFTVSVMAILVAGLYVLRAPIAVALADGDGAAENFGWELLRSAPDSSTVQEYVRETVEGIHAVWAGGERDLSHDEDYRVGRVFDFYNRFPPELDAELQEQLTHLCIAGGRCVAYKGLKPHFVVSRSFDTDPRVTLAVVSYLANGAAQRKEHTFVPALLGLSKRDVSDNADVARAAARFALTKEIQGQKDEYLRAYRRLSGEVARLDAWRTTLIPVSKEASWGKSVWGFEQALDELRGTRGPLDTEISTAVLKGCAHYAKRNDDEVPEICVDYAIAKPNFMNLLDVSARDDSDDATSSYARSLFDRSVKAISLTPQQLVAELKAAPTDPGTPIDADKRRDGLKYSAFRARIGGSGNRSRRITREFNLLATSVPPSTDLLYTGFRSNNKRLIWMSSKLLADVDTQGFSRALLAQIDSFEPVAAKFTFEDEYDHISFYYGAMHVYEGLSALREHANEEAALYPWIRTLSIPEPEFSKSAARFLRKQLSGEEFANALFRFLAVRKQFRVAEVKVYEDTLVSYPDVAPAIHANLERILLEAGGVPDRVPWIRKLIGLRALGRVGTKRSIPLVQQYVKDKRNYISIERNKSKPQDVRREKRPFSELAQATLKKLR